VDGTPANVVVVGGGAAATLLACAFADAPERLTLVSREPPGRGLAYRTRLPVHLLNVPAGRLSVSPNDPDDFRRWLAARDPAATADTFAPRSRYGEYLEERLAASGARVVSGEVVAIERRAAGFAVVLGGGIRLHARAVVLATGHRPPAVPPALAPLTGDGRLRADPWAPDALEGLPPGPVLLVGTGLTAVDVVLAIAAGGHRGPVLAMSRHGLLPGVHGPPAPPRRPDLPARLTTRGILRALRDGTRAASVHQRVDGLRPEVPAIWRTLSVADRGRFLRHARAYWDVVRHRMAPEIGARVHALIAEGFLDVRAGRLLDVRDRGNGLAVRYRPRGGADAELAVGSIVLCTGPAAGVDGLLTALVASGLARPDPLGLGVDTEDGEVLDARGARSGLFAIGPPRVPAEWESTAIVELRRQAGELARRLAAGNGPPPGTR
jgi:uncharacterized NAD(P)/FAD-binding protein YdhS